MKRAAQGSTVDEALRALWLDPHLKERCFSPWPWWCRRRRQGPWTERPFARSPAGHCQKSSATHPWGTGGAGAKASAKALAKPSDLHPKTPSGENICYAFNTGGCTRANRRFKHIRGKFFGRTPQPRAGMEGGPGRAPFSV